jgi:hypothetical protein
MLSRIVLSIFVAGIVLGSAAYGARTTASGAGTPQLPDLQTLPPDHLRLDTVQLADGRQHNVIRFDNTILNSGAGRLEFEGKKRSKVYQNIYDTATGGALAEKVFIGNDSVFHPGHNHYHIENFASYVLLRKDASGAYVETSARGTKTSFCIVDTVRIQGSYAPAYTSCGRTIQGLTVGWADVYGASLADQWVDLGIATGGRPLADGEYAIQSTANPGNGSGISKIRESNYSNNMNRRYFTVVNGVLTMN